MTQTIVSASQFRDALGHVRDCISSLTSARASEVDREALYLKVAVSDLCRMGLKRDNDELDQRRRNLIARSSQVIAERSTHQAAA